MKKRSFLLIISAFLLAFLVLIPGESASAAAKVMPDGTVFDASFYASAYPDVVSVFGTSEDMLYFHYTVCGKAEGRLAVSPSGSQVQTGDFDASYYAARYPDVVAALGKDPSVLKLHYELFGKNEGRFANAYQEAGTGQKPQTSVPALSGIGTFEQQVLDICNAERIKIGLAPLSWDPSNLAPGAAVRAQEITTYFSHTRPDGSSCFTAVKNPGRVGENIAAGQASPQAVMNSWMNSQGHRANILNPGFAKIGIGHVYAPGTTYGHYWVQMFSS